MAIDKPGISPTLFWPAQYEAIGDPVSVKIAIFTFYDSLAKSGEDALTLLQLTLDLLSDDFCNADSSILDSPMVLCKLNDTVCRAKSVFLFQI
jgi:hypothetical protein